MTARERVAVVTPRLERRRSAESWAPLLEDRAEIRLCESLREEGAREADLVVVDEACPDLDAWLAAERGGGVDSVVVFGAEGPSARGAVPWGEEGTEVLATIADFLERRRLLREADQFLEELRFSSSRLEGQRRRFARLALEQAEVLRGANASLVRELEHLRRLQPVTRFFAAPGPPESFAERLAEVLGRALGGAGAAVARRRERGWELEGLWRISRRNACGMLPAPGESAERMLRRPSTRRGHTGWWVPIARAAPPEVGLALLMRGAEQPGGRIGKGFSQTVTALASEALETRARTEDLLSRTNQNEEILRKLRGGLLRIDRNGRISLANPACAEILGTTVSALEGKTLEEAFPRDSHLREILFSIRAAGGAIDDVETSLTTARGTHVLVSVRASCLRETRQGGEEILVLISDLSRRKAVEEEVRRADRLAALGRLSAGVAHEVRNPLAGIRTTAEILRSRVEEQADLVRFVDVILEEAARLDRIVQSLLQFGKPPEPRTSPVDVGALLERARQLSAGRAAEKRVAIRVAAPGRLPAPPADRDQILQVLLNLLLNAIEATPAGGEIRLGAGASARGPRREIRIVVEDQGSGVPPSVRERIFDPFFTTKPGGTGLGLSISQNILRQHGGTLRLEGEEGGPTRAVVSLPLPARSAEKRPEGEASWQTS